MDLTSPLEGRLAFYVVNNLRFQQAGENFEIQRQLTLPQAIARYNGYHPEQVSAIGATIDDGFDIDIVQRRAGANTLVSDYQKMNRWEYNPELCISAVSMMIGALDIRQQLDDGSHIRPLEQRYHILQLRDGDATRDLRWEPLQNVKRMGLSVNMRNYVLAYSDTARADETSERLYQRLNTQPHPEGYRGHPLSISDVLIYQGRAGCFAYYVDKTGFTLMPKFVRPPGSKKNETEAPEKRKRAEEAR